MSQELVQSGQTYTITNAKSGTVMDLSGLDNRSVIGFPAHGGPNQKWTLNWTGRSWTFQSVYSGLYLALDGSPSDGTRLVAAATPAEWHIWHDDVDPSAYRIFVPFTRFNLDLYGHGNPAPSTPITTWYTWRGIHQTWRFALA